MHRGTYEMKPNQYDVTPRRFFVFFKPSLYAREGTAFFPGSSLAGEGLLVSDGNVWARQRRLSNPAFRRAAVDTYADAMANAGAALLNGPW